jgi:hypothetical protein
MRQSLFVKSIKTFNPKLVHTTLLDFAYILLIFVIAIGSFWMLSWAFSLVFNYWLMGLGIILVIILSYTLIIANMAFFKNTVWNMTLDSKRKFIPFLKLTAVWFVPWIVVFYLLRNSLPINLQPAVLSIYALVYLHFTTLARLSFKKSVKKAFFTAFDVGFWKFPKFIIPYFLIFAAYWIVMFAISFIVYLSETLFIVCSVVAVFTITAWARYYISLVFKK